MAMGSSPGDWNGINTQTRHAINLHLKNPCLVRRFGKQNITRGLHLAVVRLRIWVEVAQEQR